MPLDEFKTQVLLLHSEQSTLDTMSSGFSDRYTVHCATSGSEALNTLVETPINVIVTAQDLPGMSGLDALREAKKRSPDTVGILLVGNVGGNVEALVGDKEVFEVVRGDVTSASLLRLVERATRQVRLLALAESANDTAANPDEPAHEHIVMETSENGSTIISDGTGRMPMLDPTKVAAAVSVGSRSVDILVLTKDEQFLTTIKNCSRGMHNVHFANTLAQADEAIRQNKVGAAVIDAAMVGDKVEKLTQHLRKGSPRLVSIVAGRRDDGEMLMDLINRGKVYRFLMKPVSPGRARLAIEASVKHHLEAPQAAFVTKGNPTATVAALKPAPKPVAKPAPKPAAKRVPKPKAAATPKKRKPAVTKPVDPPLGKAIPAGEASSIEERLASAFGDDDSSFTETVTGLISKVGRKFSAKPDSGATDDDTPVDKGLPNPMLSGSGSGESLSRNPKMLAIAAAAAVVVAGALFWSVGGSDDGADSEITAAQSDVGTESVDEEAPVTVDALANTPSPLDAARIARASGQIFNPAGNNAIELFVAALEANPDDAVVAAELDAVLQQALGMAETAMLETRLTAAENALQRVAVADAGNTRLPFLTAQLSQMQMRARTDEARVAIRENRFQDAQTIIAAARRLNLADYTEIDAVDSELSSARRENQAGDTLAKANAALESGDLLNPPNGNARYYFELVLANDSGNTAAQQGLGIVSSVLVLQAQTEINNGNLNAAEKLLGDAQAVNASNSEIASTETQLASARDAIIERRQEAAADQQRQAATDKLAAEQRQAATDKLVEEQRQAAADKFAEEQRHAAADKLAEEQRQAAADKLAEEQRQAAADKLAEEQRQADADKLAEEQRQAAASTEPESQGTQKVASFAKPGIDLPAGTASSVMTNATTVDRTIEAVVDGTAANVVTPVALTQPEPEPDRLVPVSSLQREKYVAPKYPRSAQRRNISGWVDVVFTVTADGSTADITARNSEPGDTFVNSALKAVEKWEFQPITENGVIVEKRAGIRMMFAIE